MVSVDSLEIKRYSIGETNEAFEEFKSLRTDESSFIDSPAKRVISPIANVELMTAIEKGDIDSVKQMDSNKLELIDRNGDTALHLCVFNNKASITAYLLEKSADVNAQNSRGWTPLHTAVSLSLFELVEMLCYQRADTNIQDDEGNTALHMAMQQPDSATARLLLNFASRIDIVNKKGCLPIHYACQNGHSRLVKMLCSMGSPVDVACQYSENTPLHLATLKNDADTVRCLLLCGANPDKINCEYRKAEHLTNNEEILNLFTNLQQITKVSPQVYRQELQKQLTISENPLTRLKIVVLGHTGVGKTMLMESLKCGFLKSVLLSGYYTLRSTTRQQDPAKLKFSQKSSKNEKNAPSRGVSISKGTIADLGDVLITECPGYQGYLSSYSLFVGDSSSVYLIVVSLKDAEKKRLKQISFWLAFLKARLAFSDPIGMYGCNVWSANVIIVATSASSKSVQGDSWLQSGGYKSHMDAWQMTYYCHLKLCKQIFTVDAQMPKSAEVKKLKATLADIKHTLTKQLPTQISCFDHVLSELKFLAAQLTPIPLLSIQEFSDFFRKKINILATDESVREILTQLQIAGEIMCLGANPDEIIILSPNWFSSDVIGRLFCREAMGKAAARGHGILSHYDLKTILANNVTSADVGRIAKILLAADICVENLHNKLGELYMASYNTMHLGDASPWAAQEEEETVKRGAVCLMTDKESESAQLRVVLPHAFQALKRFFSKTDVVEGFCQWNEVCRVLSNNGVSATVKWVSYNAQEEKEDDLGASVGCIEIECRSVHGDAQDIFLFTEQICAIVHGALNRQCPGLSIQRHPICFRDVEACVPSAQRRCYNNTTIMRAFLENPKVTSININDNDAFVTMAGKTNEAPRETTFKENFVDVFAFGSQEIYDKINLGMDLSISYLSSSCRSTLARMIDPNEVLIKSLLRGFHLDEALLTQLPGCSIFEHLLSCWLRASSDWEKIKMRDFIEVLEGVGKKEMVDVVLKHVPVFIFFGTEEDFKKDNTKISSAL